MQPQEDNMDFPRCLKRAQNGDDEAQCRLGVLYGYGHGAVPQDWTKAIYWWEKAANQGNASAQCALGYCLMNGHGTVEQDGTDNSQERAVHWYKMAAMQHQHAHAEYNLGLCYDKGLGVVQNQNVAFTWYERAARQGHREAKSKLRKALKKRARQQSRINKRDASQALSSPVLQPRQNKLLQTFCYCPTNIKDIVDIESNVMDKIRM